MDVSVWYSRPNASSSPHPRYSLPNVVGKETCRHLEMSMKIVHAIRRITIACSRIPVHFTRGGTPSNYYDRQSKETAFTILLSR